MQARSCSQPTLHRHAGCVLEVELDCSTLHVVATTQLCQSTSNALVRSATPHEVANLRLLQGFSAYSIHDFSDGAARLSVCSRERFACMAKAMQVTTMHSIAAQLWTS